MSNLVNTGQIGNLAAVLTRVLGRRVQVHRVEYQFRLPSGRFKNNIRYTLVIEGSHPPLFPDLTVNEVKGRMAMLTDLLYSGVIKRADDQPVPITREEGRNLASTGANPEGLPVEGPGASGDTGGVDQPPGDDDCY